jgi:hypothetical protein
MSISGKLIIDIDGEIVIYYNDVLKTNETVLQTIKLATERANND